MASGWNSWVWLKCIGVVSGCCCKEVCVDILIVIITFPYSTCISSFFDGSIPTSFFIFFHSFEIAFTLITIFYIHVTPVCAYGFFPIL